MRTGILLLSLVVLAGCWFGEYEQADSAQRAKADVGDLDCVAHWPTGAPVAKPYLLSPTFEERIAGAVGVLRVRLESVSYDLPSRARNNRIALGRVRLKFNILEQLKQGYYVPPTVTGTIEVGYFCEYVENDARDQEALAKLSADLEEFFGPGELIVFLSEYIGFYTPRAKVKFQDKSISTPLPTVGIGVFAQTYGLGRDWNDGSQWLLQAEGIGSDQNPHFVDPLGGPYTVEVPANTIALSEIRERVNAVVAEEQERGFECVGAQYQYQWYVRSNEESWYRGRVGSDGTPIECIEI